MRLEPPVWHASLPSTNAFLRERLLAGDPVPAGTVVAAREQTAGRGRGAKTWVSSPGRDLAFSVLLHAAGDAQRRRSLPMVGALAVAEALASYGLATRLKWPNDVRVGTAKIAGVLADIVSRADAEAVVLGIGVNVNMTAAEAARIDPPATSLYRETGRPAPLEEVLACILCPLQTWLTVWTEQGFAGLRIAWEAQAEGVDRPVRVFRRGAVLAGVLHGFGPDGELLVQTPAGAIEPVCAADRVELASANSRKKG